MNFLPTEGVLINLTNFFFHIHRNLKFISTPKYMTKMNRIKIWKSYKRFTKCKAYCKDNSSNHKKLESNIQKKFRQEHEPDPAENYRRLERVIEGVRKDIQKTKNTYIYIDR